MRHQTSQLLKTEFAFLAREASVEGVVLFVDLILHLREEGAISSEEGAVVLGELSLLSILRQADLLNIRGGISLIRTSPERGLFWDMLTLTIGQYSAVG